MVTSRDLPSIASYFEGSKRFDILASNQDLWKYVKGRIATSSQNLAPLEGAVAVEIVKNAGNM
jgi:hypothetical protein